MIGKVKEGAGKGRWYYGLNCIFNLEHDGVNAYRILNGNYARYMIPAEDVEVLEIEELKSTRINDVNEALRKEFDRLRDFVISKNNSYNNSLREPNRIFCRLPVKDGILVRIDDKLNRIAKSGINDNTEDTIDDLIGYFVHLKVLLEEEKLLSEEERKKLE